MISSNAISTFHQWLLGSPNARCESRTIVLHGDSNETFDPLILEITAYLNEYDDEGVGHWLAATSGLVREIVGNPELLCLLSGDSQSPVGNSLDQTTILTALGRRGQVVLRDNSPDEDPLDLPAAFHAGLGNADCGCAKCHLVLNPDLVHPHSLAHMVSDVFLDWYNETRRRDLPEITRNALPSAIHEQPRFPNSVSI